MAKLSALKAQARSLLTSLQSQGLEFNLGKAQDIVARMYGMENWNALTATLDKSSRAPGVVTLADLKYMPNEVALESGSNRFRQLYNVAYWDFEVMELLHQPQELQAFLDEHPRMYADGMDTYVVQLQGDGHDVALTIKQLQDGEFVRLKDAQGQGTRGYWKVPTPAGELLLDPCESGWGQPKPEKATDPFPPVPQVVKTLKGSHLIALRSHDGSDGDHFVMVPAHIPAELVRERLNKHLDELKARDRELEDESLEYTDSDIEKFVRALGCEWVAKPIELGQNWDV